MDGLGSEMVKNGSETAVKCIWKVFMASWKSVHVPDNWTEVGQRYCLFHCTKSENDCRKTLYSFLSKVFDRTANDEVRGQGYLSQNQSSS